MSERETHPDLLSRAELESQTAAALPAKEVYSLLDLNVVVDVALDLAAPIDLAVAANLNVVAPIDAAVGANILSFGSEAGALSSQTGTIDQQISGSAIAHAPQTSIIDQSNDTPDDGGTVVTPPPTDGTGDVASLLNGNLLNVNVDVDLDADLVAPVAGAVAANANVAAPIDAAVAANVVAIDSDATAITNQNVQITQHLNDVLAEATADQDSTVTQ